jgi:hypothetical protein
MIDRLLHKSGDSAESWGVAGDEGVWKGTVVS